MHPLSHPLLEAGDHDTTWWSPSPWQTQALLPQMLDAESIGQHSQCWWTPSLASFNTPTPCIISALSDFVLLCTLTSTLCLLIPLGSPHSFFHCSLPPPFAPLPPPVIHNHHHHPPSCSGKNLRTTLDSSLFLNPQFLTPSLYLH